ncbi:hypothetical protein [Couchioplanes azureus]|uniref:hypothetical protein n=1 Tax=Couchioplanes caeruleus TaxID=56438 RepID=UPI00166F6F14|nr:hypothetical protein [Couchioplanes caeruleus]
MSELVGVHGMAKHQRGRHQLLRSWTPALADGLERAVGHPVEQPPLDLAFYGDIYLREPAGPATKSGDDELPAEAPEELRGMDTVETAEVVEAAAEAVTPAELRAAADEDLKAYTRTPRPVQVVLRALDRRFGAAAGILYVGVLRQVRRYLSDPGVKARVDARVEQAMTGGCTVLIGHSLGSVVAHEYLRQHPGSGVRLFLTAGSPLGLRMIRSRLPAGRVDVPAWVNLRDLRDPVACAGELRTWWPQIDAGDEVVVDNGGDAHEAERYLSRQAAGRAVLRALPHLAAG